MNQQTAQRGRPVPRARQSYLFEHAGTSPYPSFSVRSHADASDDRPLPRDAAITAPEPDPDDPDSLESEPASWPAWTDAHRYAPDRLAGRGEP